MSVRLGVAAARRVQAVSLVLLGLSLLTLVALVVGMGLGALQPGVGAVGEPGALEKGTVTGIWLLLEHGAVIGGALLTAPVALAGLAWALWSRSER